MARCGVWCGYSSRFASSLVLVMSSRSREQRQEASCCVSSSKGTSPFPQGPTLMTYSPPNTMTLGLRCQPTKWEMGGQTFSPQQPMFHHLGYQTPGVHPRTTASESQAKKPRSLVLIPPQVVPGIGQIWEAQLAARGSVMAHVGLDSPPPRPAPNSTRDSR